MAPTNKKNLYSDAVELLEKINAELYGNEHLETINSRMVGVVKELNDVRIEEITLKEK